MITKKCLVILLILYSLTACKKTDLPDTSRDIPPAPSMEINDPEVLIKNALFYISEKKGDIALDALKAALEKGGDKILVTFLMGRAYQVLKKYDESIKKFNEALKLGYPADEVNLYIGAVYVNQKKYDDALKYFQISERLIAGNAERTRQVGVVLFLNLGQLYMKKDNFRLAMNYLERAIGIDTTSYDAFFNAGLAAYKLNDYNKSIKYLEKAISLKPRMLSAYRYLATAYYTKGEKDKSFYIMAKGFVLTQIHQNIQSAHTELSKIQNIEANKDALELMIYSKIALNLTDAAEKLIKAGIQKYPQESAFYIFHGRLKLKTGNAKEALKIAEQSAAKFGSQFEINILKAECYERLNQDDNAIKSYETALKLNPENYTFRYKLADLYRKKKNQLLEYLHQGIYYTIRGQYEEAKFALDRIPEDFPRKSELNCWKGRIFMEQNVLDVALKHLDLSIKQDPSYFLPYTFKCFVLFRLGRKAEGLNTLRSFMAQYPQAVGIEEVRKLFASFSRF